MYLNQLWKIKHAQCREYFTKISILHESGETSLSFILETKTVEKSKTSISSALIKTSTVNLMIFMKVESDK